MTAPEARLDPDRLYQAAMTRLLDRAELDTEAMRGMLRLAFTGALSEARLAAFLTALRAKGETRAEILAAARELRAHLGLAALPGPLLDTCGTGGDGLSTINVSTAVSLLVAGAGVRVAKHGNRAVSGRTGSADVLEALGIPTDLDHAEAVTSLERCGYAFFFAPRYHGAVKAVTPVRRQLGFRTLFNVLGPLANPAGATHQVVGVFDPRLTETMAWVLARLGLERVAVVSGLDGMDELTLTAPTRLSLARGDADEVETLTLDPASLGLAPCDPSALTGGDAVQNALEIEAILHGRMAGPKADLIMANAGLALHIAGHAASIREGLDLARSLAREGRGAASLQRIREAGRGIVAARPGAGAGEDGLLARPGTGTGQAS